MAGESDESGCHSVAGADTTETPVIRQISPTPRWLYEKMLSPSETYYRGQVRGKLTSTSLPPVSPSNDGMKPEGDDGIQQM